MISFVSDGNFAIHVACLEKAEEFYSGILGFKLIKKSSSTLTSTTGEEQSE